MSQSFFQFHDPAAFLLLFTVPLIFLISTRPSKALSLKFSSIKLLDGLPHSMRERGLIVPVLLRSLILILAITALARPQWGTRTTEVTTEGVDILLTLDTSGSMKALDFTLDGRQVNRLEVVKRVVDQFISQRTHDRIGMVIFGERAYTQSPLTLDADTLRLFLDWIEIGIAGDGTAIGSALAVSVKRLTKEKTKSKLVILLTDGRNNAGEVSPLTAAEIAKDHGIKVYTIGVGSEGRIPYPQETPFGTHIVYAELDLDEGLLKQIAETTGGKYYRATDTAELEEIYAEIDQREKTPIEEKHFEEVRELFPVSLISALLLLLLEIFLSQTVLRRIP